jgi:hypothetical protein
MRPALPWQPEETKCMPSGQAFFTQQAHRNGLRPRIRVGPTLVEPARTTVGSFEPHADCFAQLAKEPTERRQELESIREQLTNRDLD